MTKKIHKDDKFRNVGMLEIVNEPLNGDEQKDSLRKSYYPDAFKVRLCSTLQLSQARQITDTIDTISASATLKNRSGLPRTTTCTSK